MRPRKTIVAAAGLFALVAVLFAVGGSTLSARTTSAFNGNVIYTVSRASTNNLKAYQSGTWTLLGQWTVPKLEASAYSQGYMTSARGTAYDNGTLYVASGTYNPQSSTTLSGQVVAWDLASNTTKWVSTFKGNGVDQPAACNGYVYVPRGEGETGATWTVLNGSTGATVGNITGPTPGPHNTLCARSSTGAYHVYLGGRCLKAPSTGCTTTLGQQVCSGATCTKGTDTGTPPSGATPGVRPFTVGAGLTRAWITWTHYRGFTIANLSTGQNIASKSFGAYSTTACSNLSAQSHGISVSPDNSQVYVMDSPVAMVRVYSGSDSPVSQANVPIDGFCGDKESSNYQGGPDFNMDGWLQHTLDGNYVLVGGSGDVIQTGPTPTVVVNKNSTGSALGLYTDMRNNEHGFIDVEWSGGVPVAGSHFGVGN